MSTTEQKTAKFEAGSLFFRKEHVASGGYRIVATGNVIKGGAEENKAQAEPGRLFELRIEDGYIVLACKDSGLRVNQRSRTDIEDYIRSIDYTEMAPAELAKAMYAFMGFTT